MNFSGMLISAAVANVLYPVLFSLFTVIVFAVFVWLCVRFMGKTEAASATESGIEPGKKMNFTALMLVLLIIGLILRLIFVFAVKGFRADVNTAVSLFSYLKTNGFVSDYYANNGIDFLPLSYYIYSFFGMLANLFGLDTDSVLMPLMVKLTSIIADLLTAFVLFKLAKKYVNTEIATLVAGFVCIFPVFVFASSVWAADYSLFAMFTVLSLYFLAEKNFTATIGCFAATLLVNRDALYLFPLFAVFVIYGLVKASIALNKERKSKKITFSDMMKNPSLRPVFTVPVSIVGFLVLSYSVSLPVMISSFGAGFFTFIYRIYLLPLASFTSFGHNSLGIFNIFMRNGQSFGQNFPTVIFTVLFAVIVTGIVLLVYLSKKNRANLVFLCGYIGLTLATYFVDFSEFSLLAPIAALLCAFLLVRDKRILLIAGVLSLLVTVNASAVMANAGYYNNLVDYNFTQAAGYAGSEILSGGISAVNIVCSALAVLAHLYATVVLLDISMSNKRKILPYDAQAGFGKAIKLFVTNKNK